MHPISVCIIAKNEEKRIEKCLSSIKSYGFEIVVVDTGSTDRTKEIASRYADKLLDFVWCDDFSAARNFSIREASNNWIFMLDCDEWIKEIDVEELNYFRKHHSDSVGAISRENLVTQDGKLVLNNTDHTERFFNKKLYHYTGIIHEQLAPIRGTEFPCLLLHTTIEHTGYDLTHEEQIAKGKRNLSLLHKQLEQQPENPYVYYQIGKGYEIVENYESACEYYGKGLYFDVDPSLAYVQAMVISYGNSLLRTGQESTALGFEQIYEEFAATADFVYLMGRIYMANEMYPQAVEQFLKATSFDTCKFHGVNSFLSFYHIGLICEKLGDTDNALAYYHKCDDYAPAVQRAVQLETSVKTRPVTKRVVLFDNSVFILQYIMGQYQRAFSEMGYDIFVFPNTDSGEEFYTNMEKLFAFQKNGIDAVFSFNNRGFCIDTEIKKSLWDIWNIPCYNLLFDHPMYYFSTLDESPAQGIVVCEDRNHVDYVRRFYPNVRKTLFLPAGGEELHPGQPKKPVADRLIDVLLVGGYKYHEDYVYDAVDEAVMDDLIQNPHKTIEQAMEDYLKKIKPDLSDTELKLMIQEHRFLDSNLCSMYRLEILRVLVESGITVTVYGDGWDRTDLFGHPHFDCHPACISFEAGIALMEHSKISLNQLSRFKDGCCERIFNAMLQKCVCVTDDSIYLREQFTDGEELVFYSLDALEKLPDIVGILLLDPARMQRIADRGYNNASAHHTWAHRAAELAKLL